MMYSYILYHYVFEKEAVIGLDVGIRYISMVIS